jgi:hypothetical protein
VIELLMIGEDFQGSGRGVIEALTRQFFAVLRKMHKDKSTLGSKLKTDLWCSAKILKGHLPNTCRVLPLHQSAG